MGLGAQGHELALQGGVGEAGGLPAVARLLQLRAQRHAAALELARAGHQGVLLLIQPRHLRTTPTLCDRMPLPYESVNDKNR